MQYEKSKDNRVIAALTVFLSGCANTDHPQTIQDSSGIETVTSEAYERTKSEDRLSASVSESKESAAESTTTVKAETESAQAENSQPAAEQSPALGTQSPQTAVPNNTPKPETPKAVEPTPEPKPAPTQQPTPSPTEETPKVEQPQETTPAPEEPAVPEFNIQTWIDYAKTYAVSVGLRLESSAVDFGTIPLLREHTALVWNGILRAGWIGTAVTKILPMSGYGCRHAPTGATICISATPEQNQNRIFHYERTV